MKRLGLMAGLALALGGCLTEANFRSDTLPRAAFELGCPAEQLTVTSLGDGRWGVAGCGRKAVYVYYPRLGYVNNTGISQGAARPAAPSQAATPVGQAAPPPVVPRAEEFVVVPIHVYLLHARGDASASFSAELPAIMAELNRIFAPAGVYFQFEGAPQTVELPGEVPWRRGDVQAALPPAPDHDGFRLFIVRDLDVNGASLGGGDLVVQERPGMRRVTGGTDNAIARVVGHVLASMLGLVVSRNESQLMAQGTTGVSFDPEGASLVHGSAKLVRGAKTFGEAVRSGSFPDAVAVIRARP